MEFNTVLFKDIASTSNDGTLRRMALEAAARIEAIEAENARLRGALEGVVKEYNEPDNGRSLRWAVTDARAALEGQIDKQEEVSPDDPELLEILHGQV